MTKRKNKKSILNKKEVVLSTLRESGPLTFEALQNETDMPEKELLSEVFKYVMKGWIVIKGDTLPVKPESILDLNYAR